MPCQGGDNRFGRKRAPPESLPSHVSAGRMKDDEGGSKKGTGVGLALNFALAWIFLEKGRRAAGCSGHIGQDVIREVGIADHLLHVVQFFELVQQAEHLRRLLLVEGDRRLRE